MEGQQSLTLHWCSVSWCGREHFIFSFAYQGSQLLVYDYVQPLAHKITYDTWPRIIDAPLALIFMIGQGACYYLICLYKQPILRLWLRATYPPADYPRYMTKNRWCSVDAHFHAGAGSALLSLFPIKAANTSLMTICNLSHHRLPMIHDYESLMLRWRSLSWWGRECFNVSFTNKGSQYFVYENLHSIALQITQDTWPRIVDVPLTLILPWMYPHHAIIWFGVVYHSCWFDSLSNVYIYFFLITTLFCNNTYKYIL